MPRRLPPDLLTRDVVESYSSRMSDADAAKELGVAMVTFYHRRKSLKIPSYFQRSGLRKRKNGEVYSFHDYDDRFFRRIDTPEKAYFLGLLASDGNISPRLTAVRIALKATDQQILEDFRACLGHGAPVLRDKVPTYQDGRLGEPQKVLVLSRKVMVADLLRHGITPCKSHDLVVSVGLDRDLAPHFLRGVWDGDGSLTQKRFKVTTASIVFARQLQGLIKMISGMELPIVSDGQPGREPLYCLCGYKRDRRAIQAIYGVKGPVMSRKYERYLKYWDPRR